MRDIVDVIFGEREAIDEFVEDLRGFLLCIGYAGKQRDGKYIRERIKQLKSEESLRVVDCLYNSLSEVVPHAAGIIEAYDIAVDLPKRDVRTRRGERYSERELAAQEAVQSLFDLDECEVE